MLYSLHLPLQFNDFTMHFFSEAHTDIFLYLSPLLGWQKCSQAFQIPFSWSVELIRSTKSLVYISSRINQIPKVQELQKGTINPTVTLRVETTTKRNRYKRLKCSGVINTTAATCMVEMHSYVSVMCNYTQIPVATLSRPPAKKGWRLKWQLKMLSIFIGIRTMVQH